MEAGPEIEYSLPKLAPPKSRIAGRYGVEIETF
jgi:hypothetical protein